jgi:hypothetical protein
MYCRGNPVKANDPSGTKTNINPKDFLPNPYVLLKEEVEKMGNAIKSKGEEAKEYISKSLKATAAGDFSDEQTALSAGLNVLIGFTPAGIAADIRDIAGSASKGDAVGVVFAALGVIPFVGTAKGVRGATKVEDGLKTAKQTLGAASDASKTAVTSIPKGSLSDVKARKWYINQEKKIAGQINKNLSIEEQAKQAFNLRNEYRTQARELMSDRELAKSLNETNPNPTWEQIMQKQVDRGLSGDDIYKAIIESSQRSRPSVNKSLGLE